MKLPRDLSGEELVRLLASFGYVITRQTGSHVRVTTTEAGEHRLTVPKHRELKTGTLAAILGEVAGHFKLSREELTGRLFGK